MRPNVRMSGSLAGGAEEPSSVDAFSRAQTVHMAAMGDMVGAGVGYEAKAMVQKQLNKERDETRKQLEQSMPRGYSFSSAPPITGGRDNTQAFEAIGGALRQIVGGGDGGARRPTPVSSGGGLWQPRGDDGWGQTPLGARGSNAAMAAKSIAGFSFL